MPPISAINVKIDQKIQGQHDNYSLYLDEHVHSVFYWPHGTYINVWGVYRQVQRGAIMRRQQGDWYRKVIDVDK